jgi:antitoxin component of MazEF toxin-antitoxin module
MKRKLVRAGGSLAVTLPAEVVQELGLEKGMTVDVTVHPRSGAVTIRAEPPELDGGAITARFERLAEALLRSREKLYRELAK